jgi:hypothetical protein
VKATLKTMLAQKTALTKWSLHSLNAGMTILTLIPFAPQSLQAWRMPLVSGSSLTMLGGVAGVAIAYRRAKRFTQEANYIHT